MNKDDVAQAMDALDALETARAARVMPRPSQNNVKATSLDELSRALKRQDILVVFPNPTGGDDINIFLSPLEPGEQFDILESMLSPNVTAALDEANSPDVDSVRNAAAELRAEYERGLEILERSIIEPAGVTVDILRGWDQAYIGRLVNALLGDARSNSPAARFPEEDSPAGE